MSIAPYSNSKRRHPDLTPHEKYGLWRSYPFYIKEALSQNLSADHPQKILADDLFKLTKALETLGGLTHQHPELFQEVFMQKITDKLGEQGLVKLMTEPQAAVEQLFPKAASVNCDLLLKSAAEKMPGRSAVK
jgi:hypothetical protein